MYNWKKSQSMLVVEAFGGGSKAGGKVFTDSRAASYLAYSYRFCMGLLLEGK